MTRCTQQLQRDWNHAKEILDLTMNKIAWLHFVNVNCVCEELCQITTNDVARSWIAISFFSCFYIKFHSKPIIRFYLIIILACNKQTKDLRIDLQLYFLMRWALANIWDYTIYLEVSSLMFMRISTSSNFWYSISHYLCQVIIVE